MADIQKAVIAFSALCLADTLEKTIVELASHHGGKPGPWLDQIEKAALDNARHSHAEGVSIEDEHKILDGAIKILQFNFERIREKLIEED